MTKIPRNRGRPRSANTSTPAERMRAYRARMRAAGLKRASEWVASHEGQRYSDHALRDARSLALHCLIAQKIARQPQLLEIAGRNLQRWVDKSGDHPPRYLIEWQEILDQPWPAIAPILMSMSQKAVRLRQSSPFAGVLNPQERRRVYEAFRA